MEKKKLRFLILQGSFLLVEVVLCAWMCFYKLENNEYYWITNPLRYFFSAVSGGGTFGLVFWELLFAIVLCVCLILCMRWSYLCTNRFLTGSYFVLTVLQLTRFIHGIKSDIQFSKDFGQPLLSVLHYWDGILLIWIFLGAVTAIMCLRHLQTDR